MEIQLEFLTGKKKDPIQMQAYLLKSLGQTFVPNWKFTEMTPLWIFKDIGTLNELFPFAKLAICQQSMPNPQANSTALHSTHLFISSCRYFMLVCTNFGLGFIEKSLSTIWTSAMNLRITESNFHISIMPKDKVIQAAYCRITKEKRNFMVESFLGKWTQN